MNNATSKAACFYCLYRGLKPGSECHVNPEGPDPTSLLKITLSRPGAPVWHQKGTLVLETAFWGFLKSHGSTVGRGAVYSLTANGLLHVMAAHPTRLQASELVVIVMRHRGLVAPR